RSGVGPRPGRPARRRPSSATGLPGAPTRGPWIRAMMSWPGTPAVRSPRPAPALAHHEQWPAFHFIEDTPHVFADYSQRDQVHAGKEQQRRDDAGPAGHLVAMHRIGYYQVPAIGK